MIYVKIHCGCGQKYAFDVQPVNERMPVSVQCPVCRADGTHAANEIIARTLHPQPAALAIQPAPVSNLAIQQVGGKWVEADKIAARKWWHLLLGRAHQRRRALEAQQRLAQAQTALGQVIKDAVVQELAVQRRELLQAQQCATAEISELVRRLDELKAPMQERLRSYEARIGELEKELAERNEENHELLKSKIESARGQLEAERARSRVDFN